MTQVPLSPSQFSFVECMHEWQSYYYILVLELICSQVMLQTDLDQETVTLGMSFNLLCAEVFSFAKKGIIMMATSYSLRTLSHFCISAYGTKREVPYLLLSQILGHLNQLGKKHGNCSLFISLYYLSERKKHSFSSYFGNRVRNFFTKGSPKPR